MTLTRTGGRTAPRPPRTGAPDEPWTLLADILLQRAALIARMTRNRALDPMAGLKVDGDDIEYLIRELPGIEAVDPPGVAELARSLAPEVEQARAELANDLASEGSFAWLVFSAQLDAPEAEVLAVMCAVELDPRRQRLVGYLNDDVTQRRLTPWSLGLVFNQDLGAHLAVGPGSRLRRAALLVPPADGPWATTPVTVAPAVLWWLSGDHSLDPDLPPGVEVVSGPGGSASLITAAGPDRVRRLQAAVAALRGESFLVTPVPGTPERWDAVIRQATLAQLGVILDVEDGLSPDARDRIERADHLAWAVTSPRDLPLVDLPRRPWIDVAVRPGAATVEEWSATFGRAANHEEYRLTADQLHLVGRAAGAMGGDIPAAVRRLAAGHIDATASRLRPTRTWDDIVLDRDRLSQLREVSVRCRQRDTVFGAWGFAPTPSMGVVALFAGPSGTGKTLAAEVIAGDLGIDLYKIDLANLVSKYIGETEKNLSRVFDAAEASNVALFFDEADALLGKRSEVSDAHDRYANIEVAYLLQRLERYEGLVVMATNLAKNIDPAFLRRLHVVVEFPMPGPPERRRIWAQCIPPVAPTSTDLDLDYLADTFELSGGTIRNAALAAAFMAAEEGTAITMTTAVIALRRELLKLGRLVHPSDFGRYAGLLPSEQPDPLPASTPRR